MTEHPAASARGEASDRFALALAVLVGAIGWIGVTWIGAQLLALNPPRAGDDLRLLLDAAGRVAGGQPLYQAVPAGVTLQATSLFYSYPPIVAQVLVPLAGVPLPIVLVGWGAVASAAFLAVVRGLDDAGKGLLRQVAVALPYVYPFAIALLFGNATAWLPLLFGLGILALTRPGGRTAALAGIALAIGTAVKIHPASVGLWWLVTWLRDGRRGPAGTVVVVALAAGLLLLTASLVVGGSAPWLDYVAFLRSGSQNADLASPLNIGPASQITLLLGGGDATARALQISVALVAIAVTAIAALRPRDTDPKASRGRSSPRSWCCR